MTVPRVCATCTHVQCPTTTSTNVTHSTPLPNFGPKDESRTKGFPSLFCSRIKQKIEEKDNRNHPEQRRTVMDASTQYKVQILRYVTVAWTVICFWEHIIWFRTEATIWSDLFHSLFLSHRHDSNLDYTLDLTEKANHHHHHHHHHHQRPASHHRRSFTPSLAPRRSRTPSVGRLLVLAVRYSLLICSGLSFTFFLGRPDECSVIFTALWAVFTFTWACGSAIFLVRVYIIWLKDKRVLAALLLVWSLALAGWIFDVTQYKVVKIEDIPSPQPWCSTAPDTKFRAFSWGLCLLFDTSVLFATLYRLRLDHGTAALVALIFGRPGRRFRRPSPCSSNSSSVPFVMSPVAASRPSSYPTKWNGQTTTTDDGGATLGLARQGGKNGDPLGGQRLNRATFTKQYVLHSTLLYFFIAFAVNLTCFVVELTVEDMVLSHIPTPIAFALNPVIAVRSVFAADSYIRSQMQRHEEQQQQQHQANNPTSFSTAASTLAEARRSVVSKNVKGTGGEGGGEGGRGSSTSSSSSNSSCNSSLRTMSSPPLLFQQQPWQRRKALEATSGGGGEGHQDQQRETILETPPSLQPLRPCASRSTLLKSEETFVISRWNGGGEGQPQAVVDSSHHCCFVISPNGTLCRPEEEEGEEEEEEEHRHLKR
ncbi:hypothetical protein IE53DRAFT_257885 [Violaceomyces palustris]|uniref:Uncharacterized protein n=1 Tax=Violaceomyces palustris TaxID=1673888 RepID=A0ACD0P865_9BASI|nr:hypothetical protein IE53DRAFT_257885 [Violaceomyces palustris]